MCVAVDLPVGRDAPEVALPAQLTPEERKIASAMAPLRRVSWAGGRMALRLAARELGWELATIDATHRGAPRLPPTIAGSIAHKSSLAVAIAGPAEAGSLGLDLEELDTPRPKIAKLVLHPTEREHNGSLPDEQRWLDLLIRFSLKEAIFKAIDPAVQRYVGFKEAIVHPHDDGTAGIVLHLAHGEGPFRIDARWSVESGHVLTTVLAVR